MLLSKHLLHFKQCLHGYPPNLYIIIKDYQVYKVSIINIVYMIVDNYNVNIVY